MLMNHKYSKKKELYCEILLQFKINFLFEYILKYKLLKKKKIPKAEFSVAITAVVKWSFRNDVNILVWCSKNISYYQC